MFAVVQEGDSERRLFVPLKMNLAPKPAALAFTIRGVETPRIEWEAEPLGNVDVEALVRGPVEDHERDRSRRDYAANVLTEILSEGPIPVTEVRRLARDAGVSSARTLDRVKEDIGVVHQREGFGPGSRVLWALPGDHTRHTPPTHGERGEYEETQAGSRETPGGSSYSPPRQCEEGHVASKEGGGPGLDPDVPLAVLYPAGRSEPPP